MARSLAMYYGKPFGHRRLVSFYRQFVETASVCFDVGAHVGNRTRAFLSLGAQVVAIEPQANFMQVLRRLYGSNPRVALIEAALGESVGEAEMLISEDTPTVTTLNHEWVEQVAKTDGFAWVEWNQKQQVELTTLDALIEQFDEPAFCKIDVEGYELQVLKGLTRPIKAISLEYTPAAMQIALDCIAYLDGLGHYEFNWARAESMKLQAVWVNAEQLTSHLHQIPPEAKSGDIYARRID